MESLFGSDSDSENETSDQSGNGADFQSIWIELMKIKPASKKRMVNSIVELDTTEILLHRSIAIISGSTIGQESPAVRAFLQKLTTSSFIFTVHSSLEDIVTQHDVLVILPSPILSTTPSVLFTESTVASIDKALVKGGTLLCSDAQRQELVRTAFSSSRWHKHDSQSKSIIRYRKRCVDCNTLGANYWGAAEPSSQLDRELELLDRISVPLTIAERKHQILSDESHKHAVNALQQYGLCVFCGLFPSEVVLEYGAAARADMAEILNRLENRGIDLLHPLKAQPRIENYHEMSMREALRCDIRNGRDVLKLASRAALEPRLSLRGHPGIEEVLLETMNPVGDPETSKGNWGRWNFGGGGPEAKPPPLKVGQLGCVMSLPGSVDQTIHADTAHLYVHTQLPGHYYNLFLPAVSDEDGSSSLQVGQTAFVAGSHELVTSAKIMTGSGGQAELSRRLVRPHLSAGDGLIFDCRILHFGLGNKSAKIEGFEESGDQASLPGENMVLNRAPDMAAQDSSALDVSSAARSLHPVLVPAIRPMLYVNYTMAWFTDPKNWNDKERLFNDD